MAFCCMCGKTIADTAAFCPYCGSKTELRQNNPSAEQIPDTGYVAPMDHIPTSEPATGAPGYTTGNTSTGAPVYNPGTTYNADPAYNPGNPYGGDPAYNPGNPYGGDPTYNPGSAPRHSIDPRAREAASYASQAASQTVNGLMSAYKKVFSVLVKKPITLWGISLLANLLSVLSVFCGILPIIWIPINLVLTLGMSSVFMAGLHGQEVRSDDLFVPFKHFVKNAAGMGWCWLWTFIWTGLLSLCGSLGSALITTATAAMSLGRFFGQVGGLLGLLVVGIILIAIAFFVCCKLYSYRFVPYILLSDSEIGGGEALRRSMALTRGWKLKMFASELLFILACVITLAIFFGLVALTEGFILFTILAVVVTVIICLFAPLFMGLLKGAFYDMATAASEK